jgi:hypothetical protein
MQHAISRLATTMEADSFDYYLFCAYYVIIGDICLHDYLATKSERAPTTTETATQNIHVLSTH